MLRIYVLGNPILEEDNIALKVAEHLEKRIKEVEFSMWEPSEPIEGDIIILDVSPDVKDVMVIDDIEKISGSSFYSLHDLGADVILKLRKEVGIVKDVQVILLPSRVQDMNRICAEVEKIIERFLKFHKIR